MHTQNSLEYHTIHKLFAYLKDFRQILLIFSIAVWIVCPLAGLVLLLIHSQINVSVNYLGNNLAKFSNIFAIIVVIFTITTYVASFESFGDTETYINTYKYLATPSFNWSDFKYEPISFIIPKYISILTRGDELSFLFIQSLTINSTLIAWSILFFPDFYPLIILINLMTAGYYFQLFWMRQFYSFIFIIPAVFISNIPLTILLLFLSYYTHVSSLFYFLPLIVRTATEKTHNLSQFILKPLNKLLGTKLLILMTLLTLLVLLDVVWRFSFGFLTSVSPDSDVSQKAALYGGNSDVVASFDIDVTNLRAQLRIIIDYMTILFFAFGSNFQKVKPEFYRWLFLFFTMLLGYVGAFIFNFNLRLNALFFCLPGFFYMIPLYSGRMVGKLNLYTGAFLFSLLFRLFFFFGSILLSVKGKSYLTFWDGDPLFTPITSYFELFFKFMISILT